MEVKYETNGSLNYIAEVISELGMNKLNQEIRYQVTKAYSKATFKALKAVGKGMTTAADGAGQLAGGTSTLNSGFAAYAAGVSQVNTGVQTLNSSVGALGSGASQLANGSGQLASGLREYTGGVGTLTGGLNTLNSKSGELNDGSDKLAAGAQALNTQINNSLNSPAVTGIMSQLGQINALQVKLQYMQKQLSGARALIEQAQKDAGGLVTAKGNLEEQSAKVGSATSMLQQNDEAIVAAATQLLGDKENSSNQAALQTILKAAQTNVGIERQLSGLVGQLKSMDDSMSAMQNDLQQLSGMQDVINNANSTIDTANQTITELQGYSQSLPTVAKRLQDATKQLATGAAALDSGVSQYTAGVSQAAAGANQLAANSGQLTSGANTLASSLQMLNRQVPTLVAGVAKLAAGTAELNANTPQLVSGITQLNAGAGELADKLAAGAKQVNSIRTSDKTADMIAKPTTLQHKSYSYVPNYGHALAPYVLSVAIYVGALVFNFVYPIRRVALQGRKASSWWASKVAIEALVALAMAVTEGGIMMALGLEVKHVPSFFLTLTLFAWASFALVMFLSMTFDNPGRFVAMVLLMLQLGGSGGTFPMEVTMKFYNAIHWYLPMTYSILGLRNGISGGLGEHYVAFCNSVLTGIIVVFVILSLLAMIWLQKHHFAGKSELDNNQELLGPEHDDDGMHLQDRDQTI